ncbi:MAG: DUF1802 family protein [Gemmataceae bacterium]|nr:DUF1802 family protein [Gemmata sp.]MDW8197139.1 DUF1802 family protein [Gemmataceae bacterium]
MICSVAFKEWAVVCAALAQGRQSLILRKGGIAEEKGVFTPEYSEFLLYPTYFHEQRSKVKPTFAADFEAAERARPPAGRVRIQLLARVQAVFPITNLACALALDPLHVWTTEVVTQRFYYRTPGLFALAVRVFALPQPVEVVERPEYAGCKTWVNLDCGVDTTGATPVLSEESFAAFTRLLTQLSTP